MSDEREKYAEIYGRAQPATPGDRAAFGAVWRHVWGDALPSRSIPAWRRSTARRT
jgi:hypothetical protein